MRREKREPRTEKQENEKRNLRRQTRKSSRVSQRFENLFALPPSEIRAQLHSPPSTAKKSKGPKSPHPFEGPQPRSLRLPPSLLTRPTIPRNCFWLDFLQSLRVVSRLPGFPLLATAAHIRGILADTITITISFPSDFSTRYKACETRVTVDFRSLSSQGTFVTLQALFRLCSLLLGPRSAGYATGELHSWGRQFVACNLRTLSFSSPPCLPNPCEMPDTMWVAMRYSGALKQFTPALSR